MKRFLSLILALLVSPVFALADSQPLPDAFTVTYTADTRLINKEQSFVSKEYVTTVQPSVDDALRAIVDAYDAQYAPSLPAISTPRRNSRLDINIVHSVSGQSLVSFQTIARVSVRRSVETVDFICHTFDMDTGAEILLADLFPADSAAWDVLSSAVRQTLSGYFPQLEPDAAVLQALCSRDALQSAQFTLGPVCLSLHYYAAELYPGQKTLMHVSVPYQALQGMMTDFGARQTDNSMYRFIALTYDDGPTYTNTMKLLAALRRGGARATFFLVGDRIKEYADIAMQENDENHSLQSHNMKHVNAENSKASRLLTYAEQFNETLSSVTGTLPTVMRAPYGTWQPIVKAGIMFPQISWDVDTKDWIGRAPKAILRTVKENSVHGSIILMHDICDDVAAYTELILEWLHQEGYLCVTVEELFLQTGQPLEAGKRYYSAVPETAQ